MTDEMLAVDNTITSLANYAVGKSRNGPERGHPAIMPICCYDNAANSGGLGGLS